MVYYEDKVAGLGLTAKEDLQRMGRYRLQERQNLKVLDLAGGIGTTLVGILKAEAKFKVVSCTMCDVDPSSRGIVKGDAWVYQERYGERLHKGALEGIDLISQDLFELSGIAEETFRG